MKSKYEKEKERHNKRFRKNDFTVDDLPHNRFSLFFDCFKVRWDIFLKIGGLIFLFALPMLLCMTLNNLFTTSLIKSLRENSITPEQFKGAGFLLTLILIGCECASILLIFVCLSGTSRIVKRLVFYEPIQFKADFFLGIKENIKPFMINGLLFVLIYFISMVMFNLSRFSFIVAEVTFLDYFLFYMPLALAFIVFLPIFLFSIAQIPIYKNTSFGYLKNGLFFFLKSALTTFLFVVIMLTPIYFLLMRNIYVILILGSLFFFLILPIEIVVFHIYACSVFDKYLNYEQYPEIYDKGIYRKIKKDKNISDINDINEEDI